jgi:dihydrofolate reductase
MSRVFSALSVSVDGYITGRHPGAGHGLGDGTVLFDWYSQGDTVSDVSDGFTVSDPSARVFDAIAGRVGACLAGRNTYDDSGWSTGGTPHPTAPLIVLSHRPAPQVNERQTFVSTGIEDAIAAARAVADDKDVALMGGGVVTEALRVGPVRRESSCPWPSGSADLPPGTGRWVTRARGSLDGTEGGGLQVRCGRRTAADCRTTAGSAR